MLGHAVARTVGRGRSEPRSSDAGLPTLQAVASHRDGAEPLLPVGVPAERQRQLLPHFYQYGSELLCADVGRQI